MATTIVTKNSTTAASVPSAGSLTQGELAVNVTDKRLFTKDSGGTVVEVGTNPSALAVAGNTTVGGTLGVTGAFSANGGATLGDASGDALTINSSAVSIPNGLNFDSNTLVIDATNNYVGIGTNSPAYKLDISTSSADATQITKAASDGYFTQYKESTTLVGYVYSSTGSANPFRIGAGSPKPLTLETSGLERMRIDSSGNVGIGTSSPTVKLDLYDSAGDAAIRIKSNGTNSTLFFARNGSGGDVRIRSNVGNDDLQFFTAGTERMRIDSSGNLLVGLTSTVEGGKFSVVGTNGLGVQVTGVGGGALNVNYTAGSGTSYFGYFKYGGTLVGTITSTGSGTAYNSISDYRLKENVAPMTGALHKVSQLKPCTYTWKSTGEASQGFIAHELQAVVPDCVTGEKDAVNEDGSIKPQGIDTSFLVATLTAAIQELKAEFDEYKATHP